MGISRLADTLQALHAPSQQEDGASNGPLRTPDVLGPGELARRLGLGRSAFCKYQRRGAFVHLEVKRPIGKRKYARSLVEAFCNGESTVAFGKGARRHA